MERFDLRTLAARLDTQTMGRPLAYAPRLASTQVLAARLAGRGWPQGTTVLAEEQMAGRGRQGRTWWAPCGQALLLSLLLHPFLPANRAQQLTMVAGLAAAEAIEETCTVAVALKWPNDLYVRERKVGGILTETQLSADGAALEQAIVGIGINVTVDFAGQPALQTMATSLHLEAGHPPERGALLLALFKRFETRYHDMLAGQSCRAEWARRLLWLGETVQIVTPQGSFTGIAEGVDELGALLVRRPDGKVETVWAGDVSLHKPVAHAEDGATAYENAPDPKGFDAPSERKPLGSGAEAHCRPEWSGGQ